MPAKKEKEKWELFVIVYVIIFVELQIIIVNCNLIAILKEIEFSCLISRGISLCVLMVV